MIFSNIPTLFVAASLLLSPIAASVIPNYARTEASPIQKRGERSTAGAPSGATLDTFRRALHKRTSQQVFLEGYEEDRPVSAQDFECHKWAENVECAQFDVLIVGGGPSGLQTALSLGRLGRSVMIVDSGSYRNDVTYQAHDVIVLDGVEPKDIRELARGNLTAYPSVHYTSGTVFTLKSVNNATYFEAATSVGTFTARKVVMATGVTDILPSIPGIEGIWGAGGFWCPWCDGWEHQGGPLAVLDMSNAGEAIAVQKLNPDTTIYTNGLGLEDVVVNSPANIRDMLLAAPIPVITSKILKVESTHPDRGHDSPVTMYLQDRTVEVRGLLFTTVRPLHSATLAKDLKLNVTENAGGGRIDIKDYTGETPTFGVWAVGDAASGSKNLAHAIFSGKSAAVRIVFRLAYEEAYAKAGLNWRYT